MAEFSDKEWGKQFSAFRSNLKDLTRLAFDNLTGEHRDEMLEVIKGLVQQDSEVREYALKLDAARQAAMNEVSSVDTHEDVNVMEIYQQELEKERTIPRDNFAKELGTFIETLKDAEGMVITTKRTQLRDPWTKKRIQHPVRSNVCHHLYEKHIVMEVTKGKAEFRCPYVGCSKIVEVKNLEEEVLDEPNESVASTSDFTDTDND